MEIDDDEAFLYGDGESAQPEAAAAGAPLTDSGAPAAAPAESAVDEGGDDDEDADEEEESDDDLEIILDGEGVAPAPQRRAPLPTRPLASPQKPTAPAPSATTEYAPLERPGVAKATSSTSVGPPSAPQLDATATDPASTALLAASALEGTPNPDVPATSTGTPLKASTVPELVPRGALTPYELKQQQAQQNPTFDVDAVSKDANGNTLFDVDIDALEDKPWRKPGANLADYFNYGMNEATWRNYARKQRELRGTESAAANPFVGFASGNVAQAWADLSAEHKTLLMATIMGFQPSSMPPPQQLAQMMQMSFLAQAAQAGGAGGMQGMQGMPPAMQAAMMGGHPGQMQAMQAQQQQQMMQMMQQQQQQQQQQQAMNGGAGGMAGSAAMNGSMSATGTNGTGEDASLSGTPAPGGDESGTPAPHGEGDDIQSGDVAGFGTDAMNPAFAMGAMAGRGRGVAMRGRGMPLAGVRGGFPAMGRGRGIVPGVVPTGPAAGVPTGPRAAAAAVPTGPRVPTGPAAARRGPAYKDKDKDRAGGAGDGGAGGLDYGAGGDDYDRSPVRRRDRRGSDGYDDRRSSRYDRSRSRERSERRDRDRERDREFERERERERERDRDKEGGRSSSRRDDDDRRYSSRRDDDDRRGGSGRSSRQGSMADFFPDGKKAKADDSPAASRADSPGLRIRGSGRSRRDEDEGDSRSRGATYSPEGSRKARRTQWSDDEDDDREPRKRKAEEDVDDDRRRRSTRRD
ncbi:hypothetical protein JCM8097_001860 [Rhodosporidiobolus ruineniae]